VTKTPVNWAFAACGLLALIAVWGHRYPVGVDLPQHANLFRLLADMSNGPFEYRFGYRVEPFTPYLLAYALALPLTKLFGALVATKLLLSFMVLATPLAMSRWLRAIGAEAAFGLVGFVVAFDYWYIWGFISCAVATPLLFAYLESYERQGDAPGLKPILRTSLLATLLFFSHGITFGVAMAVAGSIWLVRGRWRSRYPAALHMVPPFALALLWLSLSKKQASSRAISEWFNSDRAVNLFSGAFVPFPDAFWAVIAAGGVALFLLLARPKLRFSPSRSVPFALAVVCFLTLPDWIAATWLVGSRFNVFIHAFAPALLVPRLGDVIARNWLYTLSALVLAFLTVLNVRLGAFNRELSGFVDVAAAIPAGADVQTLVPETTNKSQVFGAAMMGQVPAWLTAERGGLIANDSAVAGYYQIPVRHQDVPQFKHYPYAMARGDYGSECSRLASLTGTPRGSATLVKQSGNWLLLKRPPIENQLFEVIRHGQGWGELQLDQSVSGGPLSVAGTKYARGLGTHAVSVVRLRIKGAGRTLSGACGVDDAAGPGGQAAFRIRDGRGGVLFASPPLQANAPARTFSVPIGTDRELILEAYTSTGRIDYAHADWLDLTAN
jgi:hypothetical protein